MRNWFLGVSLVLLVACSGAENTASLPKDTLQIRTTSLNSAIIGENYNAPVTILGGVSPYIITLSDGKLPPGLTLANSTVVGTPTEKGSFTFTVQVTDANLSTKIQKLTLAVTDKPPPELALELPGTPIKSLTRIPITLKNAENVAGGRLVMSVPDGLTVKGVQPVTGKPLVVWNIKNKILTIDFAFTQRFFRNKNALFLEVESGKEGGAFLNPVTATSYDLRDGAGKKLAGTDLLTPPPKPVAPPQAPTPAPTEAPKTGTEPGKPAAGQPEDKSKPAEKDPKTPETPKPADPNSKTETPTAGETSETPAGEVTEAPAETTPQTPEDPTDPALNPSSEPPVENPDTPPAETPPAEATPSNPDTTPEAPSEGQK